MSVRFDQILTLRVATADDLDDLANIACAASLIDLQMDYPFPHCRIYQEDIEFHAIDVQDSAEDAWKRHQNDHYSNGKG